MNFLQRMLGRTPTPARLSGPVEEGIIRHDSSLYNSMTGMGGGYDKGSATRPNLYTQQLADAELKSLFLTNGIAARIVKIPPNRATRRGWTVTEMPKSEDKRLKARSVVREAMTMGDLYGGSALLMVTLDDIPAGIHPRDWLAHPIDLERVGRLEAIHAFDAFEAWPLEYDRNIRSPNFRNPRLWTIAAPGFAATVHASRVLHFRGAPRPPSDRSGGGGFGSGGRMPDDSVLQAVWDEIRRLGDTMQGGAILAHELRTTVLKMGNLATARTGDEAAATEARLSLMQRGKSLLNLILLGPTDEYHTSSNPPTGFGELSKEAKAMLAAVTGIPEVQLFGTTPAGLSGTEESSWQGFHQLISDYQETSRPLLEHLYEVAFSAQDGPTGGVIPEGWELTFGALDEPTEATTAALRKLVAEADQLNILSGIYSPEDVARSRFGEDGFSIDLLPVEVPDEGSEDDLLRQLRAQLASQRANPGANGGATV